MRLIERLFGPKKQDLTMKGIGCMVMAPTTTQVDNGITLALRRKKRADRGPTKLQLRSERNARWLDEVQRKRYAGVNAE